MYFLSLDVLHLTLFVQLLLLLFDDFAEVQWFDQLLDLVLLAIWPFLFARTLGLTSLVLIRCWLNYLDRLLVLLVEGRDHLWGHLLIAELRSRASWQVAGLLRLLTILNKVRAIPVTINVFVPAHLQRDHRFFVLDYVACIWRLVLIYINDGISLVWLFLLLEASTVVSSILLPSWSHKTLPFFDNLGVSHFEGRVVARYWYVWYALIAIAGSLCLVLPIVAQPYLVLSNPILLLCDPPCSLILGTNGILNL